MEGYHVAVLQWPTIQQYKMQPNWLRVSKEDEEARWSRPPGPARRDTMRAFLDLMKQPALSIWMARHGESKAQSHGKGRLTWEQRIHRKGAVRLGSATGLLPTAHREEDAMPIAKRGGARLESVCYLISFLLGNDGRVFTSMVFHQKFFQRNNATHLPGIPEPFPTGNKSAV